MTHPRKILDKQVYIALSGKVITKRRPEDRDVADAPFTADFGKGRTIYRNGS